MELLIGIFIITTLQVVILVKLPKMNMDHYYFKYDYLLQQSKVLNDKQEVSIPLDAYTISAENMHFNKMGNISSANTLHFMQKDLVIHLGGGRIEIK